MNTNMCGNGKQAAEMSVTNVESLNINVSVRLSFLLLHLVPQLQLTAALTPEFSSLIASHPSR